jgi:predicted ATPase/class 3 adenylate cyclase
VSFEEVLDQAIAMLQRRGRVSYRALQRQFQLDDAYLQDLTAEIIEVLQLAVDQDNTMLVWTGGSSVPVPVSPPPSRTLLPDIQEPHLPPRGSAPDVQRAPEAERRQLTVMFCDLVDSTTLSSQLDPEEYREVVRAYHATCADVIQRFDGHVAQLLGDGLLVYFGYPQAHEDDAQRAVRTGLGILAAMGELHQGLQQTKGIQLALRLGVHTGLVVVGEMGGAGRQEQLALGEVPNIASRIEGLAVPNTVAVSEATYRLIQGYFECQDLGAHALRGVPESMCIYRVLGESGVHSRLDVAQPRGLTPLVGRESEVMLLLERWEQVKAGQGHVVLLTGDAGIGKSRLVQMLKDHVTHEPHIRWECRSVEYSQNSVLYPIIDLFQRLLRFEAHETPDEKVGKLEHALSQYRPRLEESIPLVAPLLALPVPAHAYPPLNLSPQRQRQKTLETIGAILLELAEQQPVLFIVEDLHWTDPTTLELLNQVIEQTPTASLLVLLTCRPHFQPAWHHRSYITEMTLHHLSHAQVAQIVTGMTKGKTFPAEVLQQIVAKTDGVPLFVEEITKAILESGQLKAVDEHYELTGSLSTLTIPATLQDSLMARLDRLVTAKAVAQYAAVIGRQFPYNLLQAVSQVDEAMLQHELGRLVEAEIVFQRGVPPQATYIFKHALIQDTAYQSLLRSTRQQYHQRIAQVLEAQFPETVESEPELLAQHYTEAGLSAPAVAHWQRAGERALQRSANFEAVSHVTRGLEVLQALPETRERAQQELALHLTLGPALGSIKGPMAPEVERVYIRACELGRHVGDTTQRFPALWGLWYCYHAGGQYQRARALGEELLGLAGQLQDPMLSLEAHRALGNTLSFHGELGLAYTHAQHGLALYDPQQMRAHALRYGQDSGVACRLFGALCLWMLGYPDQARQWNEVALTQAQGLSHAYTLAQTLLFSSILHQWRGEASTAQERADALLALCTEHGFAMYRLWGTVLRGSILTAQGAWGEGLAQMREGLATWRTRGLTLLFWLWFHALLAEACGRAGQVEEGLSALEEALAALPTAEDHFYEAEVYRLNGELLLQQSTAQQGQAEEHLHQALTVARRRQAKSWELRAAMSLSRLWQQQGKRTEAYELLAPVYGWFTEGFDTADLQEAQALLEELSP